MWFVNILMEAFCFLYMELAVDDAYIIIGSANINQRSMDGNRDTEIAIGCYKTPKDDDDDDGGDQSPMEAGDIHAYRMSLWYEHTAGRGEEEVFEEPESLDCVQRIRGIGDEMWKIYSGEEVADMEGVHLLTYPICVKENGEVDGGEGGHFPDTKTPVKGKRSKVLPPIFTT